MRTAKEHAGLHTQRLGRGVTSGDTFTTKVEVDDTATVAQWQNLGEPVYRILGDGSVIYEHLAASPAVTLPGQTWLEDVGGQTRLKIKSLDGSTLSLGGAVSVSDVYVVADQAARLALAAGVGDIAKQLDTGETYILQTLPPATAGNWVSIADITPDFATITNKPTTLSGYGITDGVSTSGSYSNPGWITGLAWSKVTGTPSTLTGYGITDGVSTSGTYADPAWLTQLAWSKVTSTPTTLVGYGITDAQPANALLTALSSIGTGDGVLAQNGSSFIRRQVQGTAGQITVTGGDGTANIVMSLPASITQATTFTTGLSLQVVGTAPLSVFSSAAGEASISLGVSHSRKYAWVRDVSDNLILHRDMTAVGGTAGTIATISAAGNIGWGVGPSSYLFDIGGTSRSLGLVATRATSSPTPTSYLSTLRSDSIVDITSGTGETHRSLSLHSHSTQTYVVELYTNVDVLPNMAFGLKGDGTTIIGRLQLPHAAAPVTPADGEIWTTTAGVYARINGATVGPLISTSIFNTANTWNAAQTFQNGGGGLPRTVISQIIDNPIIDQYRWTGSGVDYFASRHGLVGGDLLWQTAPQAAIGSHVFATMLTLTQAGSLGVGINPSAKLHLLTGANDGLRITDGTMTGVVYMTSGPVMSIGTITNHAVTFLANNAVCGVINADGTWRFGADPGGSELARIGGSARVSGSLVVGNQAGLRVVSIEGGSSGTNGGAAVYLLQGAAVGCAFGNISAILGGAYDASTSVFTAASTPIKFYAGSTLYGQFSAAGNFGIGIVPVFGLDTLGSGIQRVRFVSTNNDARITMGSQIASSQYWTISANSNTSPNITNVFVIATTDSVGGSFSQKLVINASGQVGIGNNPDGGVRLHLGTGLSGGLGFKSGATTDTFLYRVAAAVLQTDGALRLVRSSATVGAFNSTEHIRLQNSNSTAGNAAVFANYDGIGLVPNVIFGCTNVNHSGYSGTGAFSVGTRVAGTFGARFSISGDTMSFFGVSEVARQSIGGAATDPATTQTLANNIRTALINLGLCQV